MRIGLLGKTAVAFVGVGLMPLLIVPYLLGLNRRAMNDQVLRLHAVAARSSAERVEAVIGPLRAAAQAAARSPAVADHPRSQLSLDLLRGMLQAQPGLAAFAVVDPNGQEVVRVQARSSAEVAAKVLADPSKAPLVHGRIDGELWFRVAAPFPEGRGEVRLVADASSVQFVARPEELGEEALIVVATPHDGIVAASSPDMRIESLPALLVEAARTGQVSGASRYAGPDGREVLAAWAPVAGSDWFVISAQPARIAEAVAATMRQRSLVAVAAAILLAGAALGISYRTVVRPLREVVQAQRRLAHEVRPAAGGEIEQLRASFGLLEQQMKDRAAVGEVFLGRYQVLDTLGSGGMGSVFKGWDPKLQRHVALKTVRLGPASDQTVTQVAGVSSLLQEAITIARFSHPNIVGVFDVEDTPDAAFVAMEYVDGMSLERYLWDVGSLPAREVVPLAAGLARGLAAAHAQGIVHRDMKPGNVLLGRNGSVKITDFGIAAALSRLAQEADLIYGTPGYLAPEGLLGQGQTMKGDLFSLGVIIYECMTGANPFEGRGSEEVMSRTLSVQVPSPRAADPRIPEELDALLLGLLEKDPSKRAPASAVEAAERLERLAQAGDWRWSPLMPQPERFDELPSKTYSMMMKRQTRASTGAPARA